MRLSEHRYSTVRSVQGPLIFVERVIDARMGEVVSIEFPDGRRGEGEVLKIDRGVVLIQIVGESRGLDVERSGVVFTDAVKKAPLGLDVIGRVFDGSFTPLDGQPMFVPERWTSIAGPPLNPVARAGPADPIETGVSAIDGLNTLVRGQKLPLFSAAGLPAKQIAAVILEHAGGAGGSFAVVFVALGLTYHEYAFYREALTRTGSDVVAFINLAKDPVVERLLAPRFGLTVAEYLAFEHGRDVLVLITDMTNYCDALREVSTAREELPGRRGYPGYMFSDLASLYERAARIKDLPGSVTLLPVVTMPDDDITHPIPDLTGYITEGQIVLSRELHQRGIFPPVDVLPSLVQGEAAAAQIASLLRRAGASGRYDAVLLTRGGGSLEDLWAFNDEMLARTIAASKIPIVSAVGHEVDVTIADFAADLRAPTPSAAAELVVREKQAVAESVSDLGRRLAAAMARRLVRDRQRADALGRRRVLTDARRPLRDLERRVDDATARLRRAITTAVRHAAHRVELAARGLRAQSPVARTLGDRRRLTELSARLDRGVTRQLDGARHRLGTSAGRLDSLSPLAVLARGYSLTRRPSGEIVRSVRQVVVGDDVDVLLSEGTLACRVNATKERDERPEI